MDLRRRILFWNRGAERILCHRTEDVVGRQFYEVLFGLPKRVAVVVLPIALSTDDSSKVVHLFHEELPTLPAATGKRAAAAPSPLAVAVHSNSAIIDLDRISDNPSRGMANLMPRESYEYGMRTIYDFGSDDASDPYVDSGNSEYVRLIDNPILTGGSVNGYSPAARGRQWSNGQE